MDYRAALPGIIKAHAARARHAATCRDYITGHHPLQFASSDYETKYGKQVERLRENLCPTVVDAFADRLEITTWGDTNDATAETLARIQALADWEAWATGSAFVLAWPGESGQPVPHFHRHDEIVPHVDIENPGRLDWAAKIWVDPDTRHGRINIYDPVQVVRFTTTDPIPKGDTLPVESSAWRDHSDDQGGNAIPHPFGAVPVVWVKAQARSQHGDGVSILSEVLPLQDAHNKALADIVVLSEAYARPFRYLLNYQPQAQTALGMAGEYMQVMAQLIGGAARRKFDPRRQQIFTHDGPGPFGQLATEDVTRLLALRDSHRAAVCNVAGVPPHIMSPAIGNVPSGSALRSLKERLVSKVRRYQRDNTAAYRGLAELLGVTPAIEWADPIELDPLERWQVAQIKQGLGLALEDVLDDTGIADIPDVVARAAAERAANAAHIGRTLRSGNIDWSL